MLESLVPDVEIGHSTAYIRKIKIVRNFKFFVVARCPIEKSRFIFSAYFEMFFPVRAALSHVNLTISNYYFSCRQSVVIFMSILFYCGELVSTYTMCRVRYNIAAIYLCTYFSSEFVVLCLTIACM